MRLLRVLVFLLLCVLGSVSGWVRAGPLPVALYTDYDYPPFVTPDGRGLNQLLAERMSSLSRGRYRFSSQLLPRKRLDELLKVPRWQGVIAWANPVWFGDVAQEKYVWSPPILRDADLLLSRPELALEWHGPGTLQGLRLGGIRGHRYVDVEALVSSGQIWREDVPTLDANVRKLQAGRVDAIFVSRSSHVWLAQRLPSLLRSTHLSAVPRSQFDRHLFTSGGDAGLDDFLRGLPARLARDQEWQTVLVQFHLQSPDFHK